MITLGQNNNLVNKTKLGNVTNQDEIDSAVSEAFASPSVSNKPVGGVLPQMGKQVLGGIVSDIPKMVGQSIQAFSDDTGEMEKLGKGIAEYGISKEKEYEPDLEGRGEVASTAIQAARALPTSLAPQLLRAVPIVGGALATGVTGALFGGQQFQETKEKALAEGKTPEEAKRLGILTGIVQGTGDAAMSSLGAKGLGVSKKAFGGVVERMAGGKSITESIAKATSTDVMKPFLKGITGVVAGEALTEAAQDEATSAIERGAGLTAPEFGEVGPQSAKVGGMMALFLAPLGLHGHYKSAQRAGAIGEVLDNPSSSTPEARMSVVNMIHDDAMKAGIPTAPKWLEEAKQAVAANLPIPRTTQGEEAEAAKVVKAKSTVGSEALDMTTGKPIVNKDIAKLVNTYDALHSAQPDVTNEDYRAQTEAIRNSLNEMTKTAEGKTPDHVKIQEAESALKQIDAAHDLLSKIQERDKAKLQAEPDSSLATTEPTTTIEPSNQDGLTPDQLISLPIGELTPASKQKIVDAGLATAENLDLLAPEVKQTSNIVTPVLDNNIINVEKTEANLPKVQEGYTRLYRASSPTVKFSDVFDADKLKQFAPDNLTTVEGEHYTPDLSYADYFRETYGKDASIEYKDIPNSELESARKNDLEYLLNKKEEPKVITEPKQFVIDETAPTPEVEVEDGKTTLYHATPKEFENLDVSKSTDFGIHLGDETTAQYIAETSNKNNIVSTKIDTSNFIELPDLDSWQTPDIISNVQDKLDLSDPKKKAYWDAESGRLKNAYGIARQSKDSKLRVAQVNHELARVLNTLGVSGIKYRNTKESRGKYSYILLKNPESIQKEGRREKNREPEDFPENWSAATQESYTKAAEIIEDALVNLGSKSEGAGTVNHIRRVSDLAIILAKKLGVPAESLEKIRLAALGHDLGKETLLHLVNKQGKLTEEEYSEVKKHVDFSIKKLKELGIPENIIKTAGEHHMTSFGGYGEHTSPPGFLSRVLQVADIIDSLIGGKSSGHDYNRSKSYDQVVSILDDIYSKGDLDETAYNIGKEALRNGELSVEQRTQLEESGTVPWSKDANKITKSTKTNASSSTQSSIRKEGEVKAVGSKRVRTVRQVSKEITFSEETQSQIDHLNSVIQDRTDRLLVEKERRLATGEHVEDLTLLASEVVEATTLRDSIITANTPKVVKQKKAKLSEDQEVVKKSSAKKNSEAKIIVEADDSTEPSKQDLAAIISEISTETELPEVITKKTTTWNDLELELKYLRDRMRTTSGKELKEVRAQIAEVRAKIAEAGDTISQADAIPTSSDTIDANTYIDENGNITTILNDSSVLTTDNDPILSLSEKKSLFKSIVDMLSSNTNLNLTIKLIDDFSTYDWRKEGSLGSSALNKAKGLHVRGRDGAKTRIYLNGALLNTKSAILGTFAHETIGHYGLRQLFEKHGGYDNFLGNLLNNSPKMLKDILALNKNWGHYLETWKIDNIPGYSDLVNLEKKGDFSRRLEKNNLVKDFWSKHNTTQSIKVDVIKGGILTEERLPFSIGIRLADEYMAELSKISFKNREFLDNEVGMGIGKSAIERRSIISKQRQLWLTQFITKIKHLLKSIFGDMFNHITPKDLTTLIAQSIDDTFSVINPDALFGNGEKTVFTIDSHYEGVDTGYNEGRVFDQLDTTEIVNPYTPGRIEDVQVFHDGVMSGFGSQTENVRSKFWDKLNESINNNGILSAFKALGNLNSQQAYEAMGTIFKGEISQTEAYVKGFVASIRSLNSMQNQAVFEYFTNKDSDPELLPVTPLQRNNIIKAKESIRTIGKSLNDLGLIDDETYEKNEDAYLHVVYLKYIDQYKGSNKKTSMLSWMKKRTNKTDREKLALGEIKDVKFLVPETLGTMARDQVLLQMFDTIGQMSRENNLYWVMSKDIKIKYPGRRSKLTLEQAYEQLDQNKFILDMHDKNHTSEFGTLGKDALIEELRRNTVTLETNIQSIATAEAKMLQEAYEAAKVRGETKAEDQSKFLLEQYVRLPNKKQMGALANKWVRKEIANDLDAVTGAYNLSDKNNIEKFFARGGTLERINQLWKMSMVALNPGSWVRNIMGNFSLLDLSTSTNKVKLIGMLHEELSGAISGNQSEWWKESTKYGLFGSTWSAIELQDIQNTYGSDLADAKRRFEARNGGSSLDKQLHFLDERLMGIGKMMASRVGAATSKSYSLAEGSFKTVAFRDYVNIWEEQNKEEYPDGYKSLPDNLKQILLSKAATHANDAIFDYSQVNSMVKTLRRIPFGAPFITFTYKAGPAAIRAMVNHPVKFAQYATLPALMTMVAMAFNDWDDDDITKFKSSLTDYQRLNPGVAFLPFKDAKGRPQILGLDYMIPWSQYSTAARKTYENFIEDSGESPISTSVKSVGTALNEFGFLGGPTPTGIAAMLSGKDDFTGRDIVTPGASASTQMGEAMLFAYNMATPAWLSSHGWFSKMYDAFKDKPATDRFGNIKFTPAQAASDITGFRATSVNVEAGRANRRLGFEAKLKDLATLRGKIIRDRNETNKIGKIKDINNREKLVRSQMLQALK